MLMNKRIWLRLPDDNPIWNIPSELRSQIADKWLRQGANVQDFTLLLEKLNQYIMQLEKPTIIGPSPIPTDSAVPTDKVKLAQNLLKSCDIL